MKVWPIDPLDPRHLRLEVPEKLPQGLTVKKLSVPGSARQQLSSRLWAVRHWLRDGDTPGCGELSLGVQYQAMAVTLHRSLTRVR